MLRSRYSDRDTGLLLPLVLFLLHSMLNDPGVHCRGSAHEFREERFAGPQDDTRFQA